MDREKSQKSKPEKMSFSFHPFYLIFLHFQTCSNQATLTQVTSFKATDQFSGSSHLSQNEALYNIF